jgi:hypothetical protein
MSYTPKDNSGTLFKNDKREKETHPNAKGSALIDGTEYWVSAWTKEGKAGKFQSLSFERKDAKQAKAAPTRPSRRDDPEEVPF